MSIDKLEGHRNEAPARRLTVRYIFALSTVALLSIVGQCLVQVSLWSQTSDSRVINLAGRQRMLSQRLAKNVIALSNRDIPGSREERADELEIVLREWKASHNALQFGDPDLGVSGNNSVTVVDMFAGIDPPFQRMTVAARIVLNDRGSPLSHPQLSQLLEDERMFVEGMDELVYQYESEARARVDALRMIELGLLGTTLVVLVLEGLFIFRPAARKIRDAFARLRGAERQNRAVALELEAILDATPALIWYQDPSGRILRINRTASEALGRPAEALVQMSVYALFGEYGESMKKEDVRILASESAGACAQHAIDGQDGPRMLRMTKVPLYDATGRPEGIIVLAEDVTETERLERALVNLKTEEQRRIGQDLHDGLGQLLTGALYLSKRIGNRVRTDHPEESEQVDELAELMKEGIQSVRNISKGLCPLELTPDSLVGAIRHLVESTEKTTGIECGFFDDCRPFSMDENAAEHVYRIAQEAISNAVRHSGATLIEVNLRTVEGEFELAVSDNGGGIPDQLNQETSGMGLRIMKRRAELCGASLTMDGRGGTSITCRVRVEHPTAACV